MVRISLSFEVTDNETGKSNYLQVNLEGDASLVPFDLNGPSSLEGTEPGELHMVMLDFEGHLLKWEPQLTTHITTPKR